jgi:hypothetical protein
MGRVGSSTEGISSPPISCLPVPLRVPLPAQPVGRGKEGEVMSDKKVDEGTGEKTER